MKLFRGLSAFPVTPADADGRVDTDHLGVLINRLRSDAISSIGVLGSTGSYMYLSRAERERTLRTSVEAAGDTPILAGIGALRTSDVLANARAAEQAGAKGLLLAPVSYLPLTSRDMTGLVKDLAAETSLPICLYNNPGTTKFNITESLLAELAQIEGVMAVKNPPAPDGDFSGQIGRLRSSLPREFSLGYSGDSAISQALLAGCDAWYSVLAGTLPELASEMWLARNDEAQLIEFNGKLAPLWELFNRLGSIRVVHEIVGMLGLGDVTLPRPLLPVDADDRKQIEAALDVLPIERREAA